MEVLRGQKLLRCVGGGVSSDGGRVELADEALADKRVVLFYFSARWCPPCRVFTPVLHEFYTELIREEEPLEVVFVSSDDSPEEMLAYMSESHGDWLAVQHGAALAAELRKRYRVTGLPSLIAVAVEGGGEEEEVLSRSGRGEVTERGADVFREWLARAKGRGGGTK